MRYTECKLRRSNEELEVYLERIQIAEKDLERKLQKSLAELKVKLCRSNEELDAQLEKLQMVEKDLEKKLQNSFEELKSHLQMIQIEKDTLSDKIMKVNTDLDIRLQSASNIDFEQKIMNRIENFHKRLKITVSITLGAAIAISILWYQTKPF